MSRFIRRTVSIVVMLPFILAVSARAQSGGATAKEPATELGVMVGGASSSHTGAIVGGAAGWELNRWTMLEARGSWLERGAGAEGFAADVAALINVRAKRTVTPYVGAGYGLYGATFDSPASQMSDFYRRRMPHDNDVRTGQSVFVDPALRITSGVDVVLRRHLTVRPEASALVVWRESQAQTIAIFGVRIGYRFDENSARADVR